MKRTLALFALVAVALSGAPHAAEARTTETYRYVATGSGGVLDAISTARTPAGRIAPQGNGTIRATGNTLTVLIDDAGRLTGRPIEVWVGSTAQYVGWVCVPDGRPVDFPAVAGATYWVSHHDHIFPEWGPESGATVGTMTLIA
jgi:hypothetical protein